MNDNPIVKEVRKHRAAILASHGGDYLAMMEEMKKSQWEGGHEIVSSRPGPKQNSTVKRRAKRDNAGANAK